jgi:hypothetical protein
MAVSRGSTHVRPGLCGQKPPRSLDRSMLICDNNPPAPPILAYLAK